MKYIEIFMKREDFSNIFTFSSTCRYILCRQFYEAHSLKLDQFCQAVEYLKKRVIGWFFQYSFSPSVLMNKLELSINIKNVTIFELLSIFLTRWLIRNPEIVMGKITHRNPCITCVFNSSGPAWTNQSTCDYTVH